MDNMKIISEQELIVLVQEKKYNVIREIFSAIHENDLAELLDSISDSQLLILLFRLLPKELAAETFAEMDSDTQCKLIDAFSDAELSNIVNRLYVDDAVDMIEEMPANFVKRILTQADSEKRKQINELLKYPDNSAGSIMTTELVALRPGNTAADAIQLIRKEGVRKETITTCYVTDSKRYLVGVLSILDIIVSEPDTPIEQIMEPNVISINTNVDKSVAADMLGKYDFYAIPVVDADNRLVGIVTVDDAIDVLKEELTDDIEIMAAVTPSGRPYLKTSVFKIYLTRIPWLLILMISATFTGMIISSAEAQLASTAILASFIPMLMDTGGNSGSQSSVTVVRGLSMGEIVFSDIFQVIWKELRISLLCGITLSTTHFIRITLIEKVDIMVALTVCSTLICTVCSAKVIGCALPILAKRLGFDPAVMASPLITTIVDAMSLMIYFTVAKVLLGI